MDPNSGRGLLRFGSVGTGSLHVIFRPVRVVSWIRSLFVSPTLPADCSLVPLPVQTLTFSFRTTDSPSLSSLPGSIHPLFLSCLDPRPITFDYDGFWRWGRLPLPSRSVVTGRRKGPPTLNRVPQVSGERGREGQVPRKPFYVRP